MAGWIEDLKRPGEWTSKECAAYRGVSVDVWMSRSKRGVEPPPLRYIGKSPVWDAWTVRSTKPKGVFEIEKKPGEWTAKECADHHGVTVDVWMQRSRNGTGLPVSRYIGQRPVWDAEAVRAWTRRAKAAASTLSARQLQLTKEAEGTLRRRLDRSAADAEAELLESRYDPLEDYSGRIVDPWRVRCLDCGVTGVVRINDLRQGHAPSWDPCQRKPESLASRRPKKRSHRSVNDCET